MKKYSTFLITLIIDNTEKKGRLEASPLVFIVIVYPVCFPNCLLVFV